MTAADVQVGQTWRTPLGRTRIVTRLVNAKTAEVVDPAHGRHAQRWGANREVIATYWRPVDER